MLTRRLSRSLIDRVLGGVCGGIGGYLSLNAWWVRAAFIAFTFFTLGVSLLIYALLWLLIPQQSLRDLPSGDPIGMGRASAETLILLGGGVLMLGLVVLAVGLGVLQGGGGDILLPFGVLGLGLVLLVQQLRRTA